MCYKEATGDAETQRTLQNRRKRDRFFNSLTFPFSGSAAALLRGCTGLANPKLMSKPVGSRTEISFPLEAFLALYIYKENIVQVR